MIPARIEVEGFLCYRDKQVVDLEGSDLWVFSGRNGSGKSSIFDAIGFALFGAHRGGSRGSEDLINAGSAEFRILFEFDLGHGRFRIERTLRHGGRSSRQVYRQKPDAWGAEAWPAVAETDKQDGFDRWVNEHIGLNYETFTSSVLLRQGHAEKLLQAKPKERFEIVAEVADLRAYQLLHKKADARRQHRKVQEEAVRSLLSRRPPVEPAAIEEAQVRLAEFEEARRRAAADRDHLAEIEGLARAWRERATAREEALGEARRAREVIEASATIRADWARLQELDGVLPALLEQSDRRVAIAGWEALIAANLSRRSALDRRLDELSALASQSRRHLADVCEEIAREEARRGAILDRQATLAAPIARANGAEALRRAVASLEAALADHPADLEEEVARLDRDAARRSEWKVALIPLENLTADREGLAKSRSRIEEGTRAVASAEANLRLAGEVFKAAQSHASEAGLAREEAGLRTAQPRTNLQSALDRLDAIGRLEGVTECDRCGQPLTPGHREFESRRLIEGLDRARGSSEEAERSLVAANVRAESAAVALADTDQSVRAADSALGDARRGLAHAEADAERHRVASDRAFESLEEPFRSSVGSGPVADWATTTFPSPADLAEGRHLATGLSEANRRATQARSRLETTRAERSRLEQARNSLEAVGLRPGDEQAEAEHARLAEEMTRLDRRLGAHRLDDASANEAIQDLARRIAEARGEVADIEVERATAIATAAASQKASAQAKSSVPPFWLDAFDGATRERLDAWEAERRDLRDRGVREAAEALPHAHWKLRIAESQVADLDARLAEIPEAARRDPATISGEKARAIERLATAEEDSRARRRQVDALERDRDERAALEAQALEADRALAVSSKLAELLGRAGLQRALIRDAERGILDCANPILRDISGGDLELRLSGDDSADDQALLLEVVDRTHGPGRTLGVAFLSGSQRFRVAVSLALGIGQYARGQDRPIRSVIIDEGFGCLDRQGRDEMIAHLNRLKGRLDRIVLVSHQEEFAEAFKDGYHFEARDGATVVREFHR